MMWEVDQVQEAEPEMHVAAHALCVGLVEPRAAEDRDMPTPRDVA